MRSSLPLACLCCLALVPRSWAGSLDEELIRQMPAVVEALKKSKVTNVGVMKFRVQEAGKEVRFDAPICHSLAARVENLLVMNNGDSKDPTMGVIRDAGKRASNAKVGPWFSEPSERRKLFEMRYPLAWTDREVKPSLFLTGKLELAENRKQSTLTLESFNLEDPEKLVTVATMRVPTDRDILRDLGYDIGLRPEDRKSLANELNVSTEQEDKRLLAALNAQDGKSKSTPDDVAGMAFRVLVNGKPVQCKKKDGRWLLDSPPPKSKIVFRLINRAEKKLAVAVRLNGVNTINEQREPPLRCKKWITKPNFGYPIEGFYDMRNETTECSHFQVLVGAEAKASRVEYGEDAGVIQLDVYEEGNAVMDLEGLVVPRALPPSKEKEARATYLGLRSALLKSADLKTKTVKSDDMLVMKKEIIVANKDAIRSKPRPDEKEFPNPRLVGSLTIHVVPAK